jgi:hypothetical protein
MLNRLFQWRQDKINRLEQYAAQLKHDDTCNCYAMLAVDTYQHDTEYPSWYALMYWCNVFGAMLASNEQLDEWSKIQFSDGSTLQYGKLSAANEQIHRGYTCKHTPQCKMRATVK